MVRDCAQRYARDQTMLGAEQKGLDAGRLLARGKR
jgi:hypothetical protein